MSKPWLVAISGVIGSGKTTLAQGLAEHLGWTYIAESNHAARYLTDLFTDPERWAFEAQTAFLIHKSNQILSALKSKQNGFCEVRYRRRKFQRLAGQHRKDFIS